MKPEINLQYAFDNIIKTSDKKSDFYYNFLEHFKVDDYSMDYMIDESLKDIMDIRVESYNYLTWICTDTEVGICLHFLDGKPLAVSQRYGRKQGVGFIFVDRKLAKELHELILSNITRELDDMYGTDENLNILTLSTYKVEINPHMTSSDMCVLHDGELGEFNESDVYIIDKVKRRDDGKFGYVYKLTNKLNGDHIICDDYTKIHHLANIKF